MNPTNMLELQKFVLDKVSDNSSLFEIEVRKSFKWLDHEELDLLYKWAIVKFDKRYCNLIDCVYEGYNFHVH